MVGKYPMSIPDDAQKFFTDPILLWRHRLLGIIIGLFISLFLLPFGIWWFYRLIKYRIRRHVPLFWMTDAEIGGIDFTGPRPVPTRVLRSEIVEMKVQFGNDIGFKTPGFTFRVFGFHFLREEERLRIVANLGLKPFGTD